jgi:hypothetical protein
MYARLLATLCLLPVSTFFAQADSDVPTGATLEVYVKGQEASTPDVLSAMSRELGALMQPAGFRVVWRGISDPPSSAGAEHLVMVELRGVCTAQFLSMASTPLSSPLPLASSSVADGKVLPFSWVDCSALNRFLAPVASVQSQAMQDDLYGRSMARLLAHEFYHILAHTDDHAPAGIAKARFSTTDLLADHFDFETFALNKLRPPATVASSVGSDDISAGGR